MVKQIVLMSRRPGIKEFGIRSRMSDENFRWRDGKITIEELLEATNDKANKWALIEPLTEFKIEVIDGEECKSEPKPRVYLSGATALGDPIAQLPGRDAEHPYRRAEYARQQDQTDGGSIPGNGLKPRRGRRAKGPAGNGVGDDQLDNSLGG